MMNFDKEALMGKWKEVSALAQKTFSEKITAADLEKAARSLHTAFGLDSGQSYSAPLPERK